MKFVVDFRQTGEHYIQDLGVNEGGSERVFLCVLVRFLMSCWKMWKKEWDGRIKREDGVEAKRSGKVGRERKRGGGEGKKGARGKVREEVGGEVIGR